MRIKWYDFLEMSFPPYYEAFLVKNRKIVSVGKIKKYDEEGVFFFEKKRFHF